MGLAPSSSYASSITHTCSRQIAPLSSSKQRHHIVPVDVSNIQVSPYQSVPGSVVIEYCCHLCSQWIFFHTEAVSHPARPLFSYQLLCMWTSSNTKHLCTAWMVLKWIWRALLYLGDTAQTAANKSFYGICVVLTHGPTLGSWQCTERERAATGQ